MNPPPVLEALGNALARASGHAAVLVVLVLLLQWAFRALLAPRWRYALWSVVFVRLLWPVFPGSPASVFRWMNLPARSVAAPPADANLGFPPLPAVRPGPLPREDLPAPATSMPRPPPRVPAARLADAAGTDARSAQPARVTPDRAETVTGILCSLWLAGVAAFFGAVSHSLRRLRRQLRHASPLTETAVRQLLEDCRAAMKVRRTVRLLETPAVASPALCGVLRPALLLPPGLVKTFTPDELRFVFLHELAHLKRHDLAVNWLTTLLQGVHWFNPLVWLAFARLRADRELACDALVLRHVGPEARRAYGQTILKLLEDWVRPLPRAGLVGILERRHEMVRRMQLIASAHRPVRSSVVAALLLPALAVVGLTDPPPQPPSRPAAPVPVIAPASSDAPLPPVLAEPSSQLLSLEEPAQPSQAAVAGGVPEPASPPATALPVSSNSPASPAPENPLFNRFYKVDLQTLERGLGDLQGSWPAGTGTQELHRAFSQRLPSTGATPTDLTNHAAGAVLIERLRQLLTSMGADLSPPKSIYLNDRLGMIMVRASLADLDVIEQVIQMVNQAPPQVTIDAKFIEVTENAPGASTFLEALGWNAVTSPVAPITLQVPADRSIVATATNRTPPTAPFTGVLTPAQHRKAIAALEQRDGVDLLSAPRVTTLSGRQAQIKVVSVQYVVTDVQQPETKNGTPMPISEPFECGPVLDLVPCVAADGSAIQMTVTPTIREFMGYNPAGKQFATTGAHPLPQFRVRQVTASATLADGQTLVLGAGTIENQLTTKDKVPVLGDLPLLGGLFRSEGKATQRKSLFILLTPTLIDPAGNPVHRQ